MKTTKLAQADINRVSDVLTDCAQATKNIDNKEELQNAVFGILSNKLGDNPGLFKAACQVYNSCKSIHRLSSADDNTRGNSFAILDVPSMVAKLKESKETMRKAASAPVARFSTVRTAPATKPLVKKASAADAAPVKTSRITKTASDTEVRNFINNEISEYSALVAATSNRLSEARIRKEASYQLFDREASLMCSDELTDAFARVKAVYGDRGERLIKSFNDNHPDKVIRKSAYANKYKGTPTLSNAAIFKRASEALASDAELTKAEALNTITTANAVAALKSYTKALEKKAGAGLSALIGADAAKDMLGVKDKDDKKLLKKIYNPEYLNEILGHSYGRAFMRLVADPTISKYPLNEIVKAYNSAIAKLPANTRMVPATAHQALINSQVINALTTGSVPSKADTDTIESLLTAYNRLRIADGLIEGNDRVIE